MPASLDAPGRFTAPPDDQTVAETVVALEEHGFSAEVADDFGAAREAVLVRIPHGSSVMTNTSVTLAQTGIADAINNGGPCEPARNKMFALDFATQARTAGTGRSASAAGCRSSASTPASARFSASWASTCISRSSRSISR